MNANSHSVDSTGQTVAGTFTSSDAAKDAARRLHDEGFHKIWHGHAKVEQLGIEDDIIGRPMISDSDEPRVVLADDADNVIAAIGRFFSGENDESLAHALVHRGLLEADAQRVESTVVPNTSILTVDGSNHPEYAAQLIREAGGEVVAGGTGALSTQAVLGTEAVVASPSLAGEATSFGDVKSSDVIDRRDERPDVASPGTASSTTYAATTDGQMNADTDAQMMERRARLRDERRALMNQSQPLDIPAFREESFVQRRTAADTTTPDETLHGI